MDGPKLLSHPGEPYSPAVLQRQFHGMTPRDVYVHLAKRQGCKSVGSVLKLLPNRLNGWCDVTSLDLSGTYVGARGAIVIFELCKLLSDLKHISLADNYLDNSSVWALAKMAMFHSSLIYIDVSSNPISWTGGMSLLELVTRNNLIQSVIISDTLIKPKLAEYIDIQTRLNVALRNRQSKKEPNACNHAIIIRQRALKRLFNEILETERNATNSNVKEDRVPKRYIVDGIKEEWRLCGREAEIKQKSSRYFEDAINRAPLDMISWDVFMLLSMSEDVVYNSEYVAKLRYVFQVFDIDGGGYIEAKDLHAIFACLNKGVALTSEEISTRKAFYDLDDTMSLRWDEFLLMMYDLGPVNGQPLNAATGTPFEKPSAVVH
eukprot:Tbor_TRINITY_DN4144_c0_g1::TRINITY_DN4144_c0_g1_i1::g.26525::m.26525